MTMQFRALAEQAMADHAIAPEELLALRQAGWADARIDLAEAEALFVANDHLLDRGPEWTGFFTDALIDYLIQESSPRGYISDEQGDWLIARLDQDGRLESVAELELLVDLIERAAAVPDRLKAYALGQIELAVVAGEGPTRDGEMAQPGRISAAETELVRRMVFAPGSGGQAQVNRLEAEALFRIKDACLYETNAPAWDDLFVRGVANFLLAFDGSEALSAERVRDLEAFMASEGAGIGGFLGRMMHADVEENFGSLLSLSVAVPEADDEDEDYEDYVAAPEEESWLQAQLDADEELDPLEKALIAFLDAECGDQFVPRPQG